MFLNLSSEGSSLELMLVEDVNVVKEELALTMWLPIKRGKCSKVETNKVVY